MDHHEEENASDSFRPQQEQQLQQDQQQLLMATACVSGNAPFLDNLHLNCPKKHRQILPPQESCIPSHSIMERLPSDRPLIQLSISLMDTYKYINKVYFDERDIRSAARETQKENYNSNSFHSKFS